MLAAAPLVGCSDLEPPERSLGATRIAGGAETVTVAWTIAGERDERACTVYDATGVRLVVVDLQGGEVATVDEGCSSFSRTIPLTPGPYFVRGTLIDRFGRDRTREVTSPVFDVDVLDGAFVTIDFPVASFVGDRAGQRQPQPRPGGTASR